MRGFFVVLVDQALLHGCDVYRRWTFLALLNIKRDFLPFVESFVTIACDGCVMDKYILTTIFSSPRRTT